MPRLTSTVVSYQERGPYGNNKYRGNCSGRLIEDLIDHYQLKSLSDYMVGGGTTEDVCKSKKIPGCFTDLNRGFDMLSMDIPERAENIFNHPPYGNMIEYADNMYSAKEIQEKYGINALEADLGHCKNWDDFVKKMNYCVLKQFASLEKGGRFFFLCGDWKQKGKLYSMISEVTKPGTLEQIVIKNQFNCTSSRNTYTNGTWVPLTHEYLMVCRKDSSIYYPITMTRTLNFDMRDSKNTTWRDVVAAILEDAKKAMSLSEIYEQIEGHKKTENNVHWKEKIRQILQNNKYFTRISEGVYAKAA